MTNFSILTFFFCKKENMFDEKKSINKSHKKGENDYKASLANKFALCTENTELILR